MHGEEFFTLLQAFRSVFHTRRGGWLGRRERPADAVVRGGAIRNPTILLLITRGFGHRVSNVPISIQNSYGYERIHVHT